MPFTKSKLPNWIKAPPSSLAWIAFVISVFNFYFAFPRSPALEVILTQKINVGFRARELDLVLPVFLYNQGSSGTVLVAQDANATVHLTFADKSKETVELPWLETSRLVPRDPKAIAPAGGVRDDFVTETRSQPFAVEGRKTDFRYLRFVGSFKSDQPPGQLELEVVVNVFDVRKKAFSSKSLRYFVSQVQWQDSLAEHKWIWPSTTR